MKLPVKPVLGVEFQKYGRIIKGYDCAQLQKAMDSTPLGSEVDFVASVKELEALPIYRELRDREFGGMPIQLGYCNGSNPRLNGVEYHRSSEVMFAATDILLLVGRRQDVDPAVFTYDTSRMEAFLVPAGTLLEVYATTLHFAPNNAAPTGFRCAIVLPKGTGGALSYRPAPVDEDALLLAVNKWVIAHPESGLQKQGAFIGLTGENLSV